MLKVTRPQRYWVLKSCGWNHLLTCKNDSCQVSMFCLNETLYWVLVWKRDSNWRTFLFSVPCFVQEWNAKPIYFMNLCSFYVFSLFFSRTSYHLCFMVVFKYVWYLILHVDNFICLLTVHQLFPKLYSSQTPLCWYCTRREFKSMTVVFIFPGEDSQKPRMEHSHSVFISVLVVMWLTRA